MAKVSKESTTLISSAGTGYFYVNRKNKKKSKGEGKLKIKKFDPIARKHVVFEEKKLSKLKAKFTAGAPENAAQGKQTKGGDKAKAAREEPKS